WEVLLAQLMLFRFAYPSDRDVVPDRVMTDLLSRTVETLKRGAEEERVCRGDLLSRINYQLDIERWGYASGRERDEQERGATRGTGSELHDPARGHGRHALPGGSTRPVPEFREARERGGRRPPPLRRSDRSRHARGGACAGGGSPRSTDPLRRGAGQPRLRGGGQ